MFKKILTFMVVFAGAFMVLTSNSFAGIDRVFFSAFTNNYSSGYQLRLWVEVKDESIKHQPDFVESISCVAPDGTILEMDPLYTYIHNGGGFSAGFDQSEFSESTIPSGRYYLTVTDVNGRSITVDDLVKPKQLSIPNITTPTEGGIVGRNPTFRWGTVSGAKFFRVMLYNQSNGEPVYWWWPGTKRQVNRKSVFIPKGILQPNKNYYLRIEAREGLQDTDNRSRSDMRNFSTGSW